MHLTRRRALTAAAALAAPVLAAPGLARAQQRPLRLGLTNDQSSIYAAAGGPGAAIAAQLAIEELGGTVLGRPIELLVADNQNKPDLGAAIARNWIDNNQVAAIVDGGSSAVGVAIQQVTREKDRVFLITGSGTTALTNEACSPTGFQWSWDTAGLAAGTATALVKQGLDTWFFLTADYTFGHVLEKQAADIVTANGGRVLGSLRHPFNTSDFSSYLLQAQSSGAKVIALANAGGDAVNAVKQAHEFGLTARGQRLAALLLNITDVHAIGLPTAQGLLVTTPFYWDRTPESRAFAKRFMARAPNAPTFIQSGAYSAVLHYLRAVQKAGTDETAAVVAAMRATPVHDAVVENGRIREDGRVMRDYYVVQVKQPAEQQAPWDYYRIIETVPAESAALPLSASACKLLKS